MKRLGFTFSHLFWFVLVTIWNLQELYLIMSNNYNFTLFNVFITVLGVFVLIYQIKLLIDDYHEAHK